MNASKSVKNLKYKITTVVNIKKKRMFVFKIADDASKTKQNKSTACDTKASLSGASFYLKM